MMQVQCKNESSYFAKLRSKNNIKYINLYGINIIWLKKEQSAQKMPKMMQRE